MVELTLTPPKGLVDWFRVWKLYLSAFPASERKPFSVIRRMYRQGRTDLLCFQSSGQFLGFAATVNSPDLILLDYLAVSPNCRSRGIGSAALAKLLERCAGKGLFVEIESTHLPGDTRSQRLRRRDFYLRAGMIPLGVSADVFGVSMELLGWNCRMDFEGYQSFYRDHYSPWAAEHIQPL